MCDGSAFRPYKQELTKSNFGKARRTCRPNASCSSNDLTQADTPIEMISARTWLENANLRLSVFIEAMPPAMDSSGVVEFADRRQAMGRQLGLHPLTGEPCW